MQPLERVFRRLCGDGYLTSVDRCLRVLVDRIYPGYEVCLDVSAVETWLARVAGREVAPRFVLTAPDAAFEQTRAFPQFTDRLVLLHRAVNPEMESLLANLGAPPLPPAAFRFVPAHWEFFQTAAEKRWLLEAAETWELRDRDWLRRGAWRLTEAVTLAKWLLEDADRLAPVKRLLVHCTDPAAAARVLSQLDRREEEPQPGRRAKKKQRKRDVTLLAVRRYGPDIGAVASFWREWQASHPDRRFTHPDSTDDSLKRMVLREFAAMEAEALRDPPPRRPGERR